MKLSSLIDYFVPIEISKKLDAQRLKSARFIVAGCFITSICILIAFLSRVYLIDRPFQATLYLLPTSAFVGIACCFLVKYSKKFEFAYYAMILSGCITLFLRCIDTGADHSPVIFWFAYLPFTLTLAMGSLRAIFGMAVIAIGMIALTGQAENLGLEVTPDYYEGLPRLIVLSMNVILISWVSYFVVKERREADKRIRDVESELENSKKMTSLGVFASGIGHEINNPISIIKASSDQLARYLNNTNEINKELLLRKIESSQRACARVEHITNSLITFTSFKDNLHSRESFEILPLVQEAIHSINGLDDISTIEAIDSTLAVESNPELFKKALTLILQNSVEATKNQEKPKVDIKLYTEKRKLYLEIEDSGPGIPEELKEKVFLPFFTTKEVGEGSGLGLSIAKAIINRFSGELKIIGSGNQTKFQIEFDEYQKASVAA